jgi:hypothetical protein
MSRFTSIGISLFNCDINLDFNHLTDLDLFNEQKNKKNLVNFYIKINNDSHLLKDFILLTSKFKTDFFNQSFLIIGKNLKNNNYLYDCYAFSENNEDYLYIVNDDGDVFQLV